MMKSKNHIMFKLLMAYQILMCIPQDTHGQGQLDFSGPLRIGSYDGVAKFSYIFIDSDSLLDGSFRFNSADLQALTTNTDDFFSINGAFTRNTPTGYWQFQFGDFQRSGETSLVNNQIQVSVSGTKHMAGGRLVNGRPDGTWTQTVNEIKNSDVVNTPFSSTIEFTLGIPQNSFRIQKQDAVLIGRFLRDGLAHDQWELYSNASSGAQEQWQFTEGILERITLDGQTIEVFSANNGETQVIGMDERYLHLLDYLFRGQSDIMNGSNMFAMLRENARYYNKIESILSIFSKTDFTSSFKVRAPYHPLLDEEMILLDSINRLSRRSSVLYDELMDDTQLQLLKVADEEVAFHLTALDSLHTMLAVPLHQLYKYQEEGIMEFVSRRDMLSSLDLDSEPAQSIPVTFQGIDQAETRSFTPVSGPAWVGSPTGLDMAYNTAQTLYASTASVHSQLMEQLGQKQREERLDALEEKLINLSQQINDRADSLTGENYGQVAQSVITVKRTANSYLKEYSLQEGVNNKVDQAEELIQCFSEMDTLIQTLGRLQEKQMEIKELYTDEVWNPFTLTVMDEQIKKHLISSYEQVMIPYILNEIDSNLDCIRARELTILMYSVYFRLIELRDEDTSKLERRLRKEKDPQEVLELLEINLNS